MSDKVYVGIDCGLNGAMAFIHPDSPPEFFDFSACAVYTGRGKQQDYDDKAMARVFQSLLTLDSYVIGVEKLWGQAGEKLPPTALGKLCMGYGLVRGILAGMQMDFTPIAAMTWKSKLGIPGKHVKNAVKVSAEFAASFYPEAEIYGPRGGLLDGRIDALLIAEYLRMKDNGYLQDVVAKHGKDSAEAQALVYGLGRKRYQRKPRKKS